MSIKIHFTGYRSAHLQIYVLYYFCRLFHMTVLRLCLFFPSPLRVPIPRVVQTIFDEGRNQRIDADKHLPM